MLKNLQGLVHSRAVCGTEAISQLDFSTILDFLMYTNEGPLMKAVLVNHGKEKTKRY